MFVAAKLGIFLFLQQPTNNSLPYGVIVKQKSIHTGGYKLLNARSPSYNTPRNPEDKLFICLYECKHQTFNKKH